MRIAHLSDIHILNWSSFSFLDLFSKRAIGALNLLLSRRRKHDPRLFEALCQDLEQIRPDEIVITGDLTNLSLPSEFSRVQEVLQRFQFNPQHVTIVPGNHDVYVRQAKRQKFFERFLGPYIAGDNLNSQSSGSFPFVRIRGEIALIGISTAIPTLPFLAKGMLGNKQLYILENILQNLQSHFRVLLIHHPPIPYRHDSLRGLVDKTNLQQVLRRTGCELILHGHEHRDLRGHLEGPTSSIPVIGVGSGTYNSQNLEARARYNLYTIEEHRLTGIETRVHDPKSNRFAIFLSKNLS